MKNGRLISAVVITAAVLGSGCVSREAYMKEYKQTTGVDLEKDFGHACTHYEGAKTQEQYQAANLACAAERSGKPFVSDTVLSYSEFKGGYESECYFGGYDRTLILDRLSKGVGLVQPVLLYGNDGAIAVDWPATERLINLLRTSAKLNVKTVKESRAYYDILIAYKAEVPSSNLVALVQSTDLDKVKNKHYTEIISKLPAADYVVTPSQDIVDDILTGNITYKQTYFKMAHAAKNADNEAKKTFKPQEIQQIEGFNQFLQGMIRSNSVDVQLGFHLVERMKAFNESEQTFLGKAAAMAAKRGCKIVDLTNNFANREIATAEAKSENKKSFADRLLGFVQIDTSNGLDISLGNEQELRDRFISARTKLQQLKLSYDKSMGERYSKVNDQLMPFTTRAFQSFKITGFTSTNKL
jgi:hypothetical protein